MDQTVVDIRAAMNLTEQSVLQAGLAHLESKRRSFRAVWCTDARPFIQSQHFQEIGADFWLHEKLLARFGLLQADETKIPGLNNHIISNAAREEQVFVPGFNLVTEESGLKVLSLLVPKVLGDLGIAGPDWVTLREEEERFGHHYMKLQVFVHIAVQGGLLWQDLLSSEGVQVQTLAKDEKVRFMVSPMDVCIKKIQTQRDISAVQINCRWSSTVPKDEMIFALEVVATGSVVEDLVIGSFKPFTIVLWNGRNIHRESFADALEDICSRNVSDIIFIFNTGKTTEGVIKNAVQRLPYDAQFSNAEEDLRGGVMVLWKTANENVLCGGWKVGEEFNSWVSIMSQIDEGGPW